MRVSCGSRLGVSGVIRGSGLWGSGFGAFGGLGPKGFLGILVVLHICCPTWGGRKSRSYHTKDTLRGKGEVAQQMLDQVYNLL